MILGAEDPLAFIGQPLGWATVVAVLGLALSGALRFKREVDREVEARQSAERERDQANTNATKWQEAHAAEVEARKFAEIDARARQGVAADWAAYTVHLIDVIAGYERAIANVTAPPSNGTDTSDKAAREIRPGVNAIRARILAAVADARDWTPGCTIRVTGCTVRDVERALDMSHGTASARVHEMARLGYLVDTGRRAVTATSPDGRNFTGAVYDITPLGRDVLQQHRSTTNESDTP